MQFVWIYSLLCLYWCIILVFLFKHWLFEIMNCSFTIQWLLLGMESFLLWMISICFIFPQKILKKIIQPVFFVLMWSHTMLSYSYVCTSNNVKLALDRTISEQVVSKVNPDCIWSCSDYLLMWIWRNVGIDGAFDYSPVSMQKTGSIWDL